MTIVSEMSALVPWMQKRSAQLDAAATFPDEEIVALRQAGALNINQITRDNVTRA